MVKFTVSRPAHEDPTTRIIRQGTERHRREAADRGHDRETARDRQWFTDFRVPETTRKINHRKRRQRLWTMVASAVLICAVVTLVIVTLINAW